MSELTELLRELAKELGTTTEYLWSVLLKQAFISGLTDVLYIVLWMIFCISLYKTFFHIRENWDWYVERDWEPVAVWVVSLQVLLVFIFTIIVMFGLHTTVSAFFNPEYWALQKILSLL